MVAVTALCRSDTAATLSVVNDNCQRGSGEGLKVLTVFGLVVNARYLSPARDGFVVFPQVFRDLPSRAHLGRLLKAWHLPSAPGS
jgi:hypothetical protein